MSSHRVSVVIPAYQASRTLGRALESVRAQTRPADEVVVVDDGSRDGDELAAVAASFGPSVRLIRQDNAGAAAARNAGIDAASGDLIAFLDADDYWEPDKLRLQLDVLAVHPEVGLVAGRYYIQAPGETRQDLPPALDEEADLGRVLALRGVRAFEMATRIWTTTVLVRRAALGEHRFVSGLEPAEDRDLWARLVASAPTFKLGAPLATNVLEPNSLSRSSVDVDCRNMLAVVRRHARLLGRRHVRVQEAYTYRRWAAGHLGQGRPRSAILPAARRLRREPLSPQAWYILIKATLLAAGRPARGEVLDAR